MAGREHDKRTAAARQCRTSSRSSYSNDDGNDGNDTVPPTRRSRPKTIIDIPKTRSLGTAASRFSRSLSRRLLYGPRREIAIRSYPRSPVVPTFISLEFYFPAVASEQHDDGDWERFYKINIGASADAFDRGFRRLQQRSGRRQSLHAAQLAPRNVYRIPAESAVRRLRRPPPPSPPPSTGPRNKRPSV